MRTDTLESLLLEQVRDIRSVERQVVETVTRIADGVSAKGLWSSLVQLLESTKTHVERLDRIFQEVEPARDDETIFCPSAAERMRRELVRFAAPTRNTFPPNPTRLTTRESEVLRLIAEGYANKQIAAELAISVKTVEKHRQSLMTKLDLHETASVTRYAISAGVIGVSARGAGWTDRSSVSPTTATSAQREQPGI